MPHHKFERVTMVSNPRILGVIGRNIGYSLSPCLHNRSIEKLKLDCVYAAFDIEERNLSHFLEIMWETNALGFNVTQPYKKKIANLLKLPSPVNTLWRGEKFWQGTSTDTVGFAKALERIEKTIFSFEKIIFVGVGSVVESIYLDMMQQFKGNVSFLSRSKPSFQLAETSAWHSLTVENFQKVACLNNSEETLIIHATTAPLLGDSLGWLSDSFKNFNGAFFDLNYKHLCQLYFDAVSRDLLVLDGQSMLIEQARASQKIWWNQSVNYEEIKSFL